MALQLPISLFRTKALTHSNFRIRPIHDDFNGNKVSQAALRQYSTFTTRAIDDNSSEAEPSSVDSQSATDPDNFESRLSQVRLRYRSGSGKKAEVRKTKKGKKTSSTSSSFVFLPPVPLKEPVSGGLKVDFGFSAYSEQINGRMAILGLSALLLVELATGKTVIKYHSPSIVFVQVYFIAAVSAMYIKVEKEKISVWPQSAPSPARE